MHIILVDSTTTSAEVVVDGDFHLEKWKNENQIYAIKGHLECLIYAADRACPWDPEITSYAARINNIDILRYAHNTHRPFDPDTTIYAAKNGHIGCLIYAHTRGCEWDFRTLIAAAENNHTECLVYAINAGCKWSLSTSAGDYSIVCDL